MRAIIMLVFVLFLTGTAPAQIGSSISSDGTAPNDNAMLDVQSPTTGDGKGILIPRVTQAQRTTSNASLAGGLLDNSGNLRGGAAQGLIVYQTDGVQGLYFNTSLSAAPAWAYLGDVTGLLASNVWAVAGSTTNYLPRTGGTMSGALDMGAQIITNVAHISFYDAGVSVGYGANADSYGAAMGYYANGSTHGAAVGERATGTTYGAAMGYQANGTTYGAAVGIWANGSTHGAAVGQAAKGSDCGAAMGYNANGSNYGTAVGCQADGNNYGAAMGAYANGAQTNVAIGREANANGGSQGTERIAIGHNVTNNLDDTARIRGTLYLDGATNIWCRTNFATGVFYNKAFEIDHPLDPENKILRHFCMEGPQVWNVYAGNVQLVNGQAVVELPEYYSALNLAGSEIYSLTPIRGSTPTWVQVKEEVKNNRFVIEGSSDMKVSWTIKVLRNDPGCLEDLRRRPVEQMKNEIR